MRNWILAFAVFFLFASSLFADWSRRKAITIDNTATASILTNYQVRVSVTYNALMNADFSDIRFKDSTGTTLLNYWLEVKVNSTSATFWVEVPSIAASTTTTIYMYYGNAAATTLSSGVSTFPFFDDFTGNGSQDFYTMTLMENRVVLATGHYFGCFLYDTDGHLVVDGSNKTWLYYTNSGSSTYTIADKMNVDTLAVDGSPATVKPDDGSDTWANAHLVVQISSSMYVMFYTAGVGGSTYIKAATCTTPNGTFTPVAGFSITAAGGWEGSDLETNCMWRKVSDDGTNIIAYIGMEHMGIYDSTNYQIGWAKVQIVKTTGATTYVERYANNPLSTLMFSGYNLSYGGGNIDSSFLVDGKYPLFYLSRKTADNINYITRAIGTNPMFDTIDEKVFIQNGTTLGYNPEKYQFYYRNNQLFLAFQENTNSKTIILKYGPAQGTLDTNKWDIGAGVTQVMSNGLNVQGVDSNNVDNYIKSKTYTASYNKALRYRMRADTTTKRSECGFSSVPASTARAESQVYSDGKEYIHAQDGASNTEVSYSYNTLWHTKELQRLQASLKLFVDDVQQATTITTHCPSDTLPVFLAGYKATSAYDFYNQFSWVAVREFTATEPTITLGDEEILATGHNHLLFTSQKKLKLKLKTMPISESISTCP
jgi:hypothetical protein